MNLKKWTLLLTIVLCFGLVLAGCGNKPSSDPVQGSAPSEQPSASPSEPAQKEDDSLAKIKQAGKLVLGTSADYPPYEFHKIIDGKDQIVGFDIDIAREIANDIGVELEIQDISFDGLLAALVAGKVDIVMAGMTPDEERAKSVDFSEIYYTAEQGVLVRAEDKDKYDTLESLSGKTVGVQTGSIQEDIAEEQLTNVTIKSLKNIQTLVMELKTKKIDAIIMELPVANGFLANHSDLVLAGAKPVEEVGGSAVAMRKNSPALVEQVNKTIARLKAEGKIDQFVEAAFTLSGEE